MTATIDGTTGLTAPSGAIFNGIASGTAVASTSGTSIDFTSIPSWVKRITVMLSGVSTSGTSFPQIQVGTSGGVVATGYQNQASRISTGSAGVSASYTTGFVFNADSATNTLVGQLVLNNLSGNTWVGNGSLFQSTTAYGFSVGGIVLAATLDRIRITTVNGTDTFDAGSINILFE